MTRSRKYLFTVWPFTGHIHPNLAIAERLRTRGHAVAFYSGETARQAIEREGFEFFPLTRVDEARINQIALSGEGILSKQGKPGELKRLYREWVLDSVPAQIRDLEEILKSWQPDAVVCDPTVWAPFLVLHERFQIPVAIFSLIPACFVSGPDAPIVGFPMPRPKTPLERMRTRVLRTASSVFLLDTRRAASALRQTFGLPPLTKPVTDFAATMPLYLVPSSPAFDYDRQDLPASVHYVGPCLREAGPAGNEDYLKGLRADLPWIYVSEGTVHLDPLLLRCAAQGLAGLPVEVIITTGKHRDPEALALGPRPLAPNIHVFTWADLQSLLPRLSGVVSVGGPSTIMAALNSGIPVVIVPFAWDHPETGWRVRDSGAGVLIRPRDCTPENVRDAVMKILKDPSFKDHAARLARGFHELGGAERAAELIERELPRHTRNGTQDL